MVKLIAIMMVLCSMGAAAQDTNEKWVSHETMKLAAEMIESQINDGEKLYEMDATEICEFVIKGHWASDSAGPDNEKCHY